MPALIQFVDSISASPTVRLDINDSVAWFCTNFSAPLPRLRRSESGNSMRDGGVVGSATYENRTLEIELTLVNTSTEDAAATEMQKLWRELDRPTNYLRYQREGMTKPVFFRLFRSDASDFEELWTTPIARNITLEILAEPFALGLPESLGPFTVNNDPAAGSNGCFFDVTGVLGDVTTPMLLVNNTAHRATTILAVRQRGTPSALTWIYQGESLTLGTDTTNPGGGPDAAMSGAGTNNYVRTSFTTNAAWAFRAQSNVSAASADMFGTYTAYAAVRRSDATSVINVGIGGEGTPADRSTTALTTSRQLVRLGTWSNSGLSSNPSGGRTASNFRFACWAERLSGSGTLDWDVVFLVPGDTATMIAVTAPTDLATSDTGRRNLFDGVSDYAVDGTYTSPSTDLLATSRDPLSLSGKIPDLAPNQTNRMYWFTLTNRDTRTYSKTITDSVSVTYWPRYLYVRPVST